MQLYTSDIHQVCNIFKGFLNYLEGCSPSDNSAPVPVAGASPLPAGNAAQQDSEGGMLYNRNSISENVQR